MRHRFFAVLLSLIMMSFIITLPISAAVDYNVNVGSVTITPGFPLCIEVPSAYQEEYNNHNGFYYHWSSNAEHDAIIFVNKSKTKCNIEVKDITASAWNSGVEIYYDFTNRINGSVYEWKLKWIIELGGSNPDLNDGDTFHYSWKGVNIQFKVISASAKTCMVGTGLDAESHLAVPSTSSIKNLYVPETANGFKVIEVSNSAFWNCKKIENIILPESITKIGDDAFNECKALTTMTVPDNVTHIGNQAFAFCDNLREVTLGKSVERIGFYSVFANDDQLKKIISLAVQPPSVGYDTFNGLIKDSISLYLPAVAVYDYKNALYWKDFVNVVTIGEEDSDGAVFAEKTIDGIEVKYRIVSATDKTCEVGIGKDGDRAISDSYSSKTITIPSYVYSYSNNKYKVIGISAYAFKSIEALTTVELPDGLTYIGRSAFYNSSLANIIIPSSMDSIGVYAFYGCKELKSIKIPDGIKAIEYGAFMNCEGLTSITLPDGLKHLKGGAFAGCINLSSAEIPGSLKTIQEKAFQNCTSLTSLILHDGISLIGRNAFSGCPNLSEAKSYSKKPIMIEGIDRLKTDKLLVPKGTKGFYANEITSGWVFSASNIEELEDMVIKIFSVKIDNGYNLFFDVLNENLQLCELYDIPSNNIKTLSIPDVVNGYSVYRIGYRACVEANNTEKIVIPQGVSAIGEYAFERLSKLKEVVLKTDYPFEIEENVFNSGVYENCTLFVPLGTKSMFESTTGWKNFKSIVEFDISEVKGVIKEEETPNTFSLSGQRLAAPRKGVNIVGGRKVVVR